jgi:IS605 OrfB family transposase
VPCTTGDYQRRLLAFRKGEADLALIRGKWFLVCTCDVPETESFDPEDWLGVDLGIVNVATDSDGRTYTGEAVEAVRSWHDGRKQVLQSIGTKAAKRRLRKLSGRQRRFQKHSNHCIAKALVQTAQRTGRGIALEDLRHIRSRVTARRGQRARLHNWSFGQLRAFVGYKAALAGVPVLYVDPKHTSLGCSCCGVIDKRNRPDQATFSCIECGHAALADFNAAMNIRLRAARATVTRPDVLAVA